MACKHEINQPIHFTSLTISDGFDETEGGMDGCNESEMFYVTRYDC